MRQLKVTKTLTNRDSASLDKYLQEVGRIPLINADKEVELARRIRAGDKDALNQLVKANLRFVVSVAKQYQNQGMSLPDLISIGNMGLIKAAGKFDETRGFKFISYAVWWIRQHILQYLAEQARMIRLPLNQVSVITKVNRTVAKLEQEYERAPSAEEIAEEMDVLPEKVEDALMNGGRALSLDAPFREGESNSLVDLLVNEDNVSADRMLFASGLVGEVERLLVVLTEREREIIKLSFGIGAGQRSEGMTLDEIGTRMELTRERVRQIKDKSIKRLRHSMRGKEKTYLD